MNRPLYTREILRLAASLKEPSRLEWEDGRAELRSQTCGSRISTSVQIGIDGRIVGISQVVHACAFGQASSALLEQGAPGRTLKEVGEALAQLSRWLEGAEPEPDWPGICALAPARCRASRHGAILLPFRALCAAMDPNG
jgi:NifU-like protein involved in Fe-S cluster formation